MRVVNLPRFLRLSPTARLAFYDLSMAADDDGFVEAFTVMKLTGATEEDLKELERIDYIRILNDDLLCWIVVWADSNRLSGNHYHPSIYHNALDDLKAGRPIKTNFIDAYKACEICAQNVDNLQTSCTQNESNLQPQSMSGQVISGQVISGESMSMSGQGDMDNDHNAFFQQRFPARLKEHLSAWYGFKHITLNELKKLLYDDGIAPEVIAWIAGKAADADKSPKGYFWGVIEDKCHEQNCTTLEKLIQVEGVDRAEKQRIIHDADKIKAIRADIEEEWRKAAELPY